MPFDPAVGRDRKPAVGDRARTRSRRRASRSDDGSGRFFLYVEGPRDGELLRVWARRLSPSLARRLERCVVILGGRQPARAVEHFRAAGGVEDGLRGLVVLDRDHHDDTDERWLAEPGLDLFTWGRRHIESYVLVREAIRRVACPVEGDDWIGRLIEDHVPHESDESAFRDIDAKRLLGSKGALTRELGQALSAARIARAMRRDELHADILALYDRIRVGLGLTESAFEVVRRPSPPSRGDRRR